MVTSHRIPEQEQVLLRISVKCICIFLQRVQKTRDEEGEGKLALSSVENEKPNGSAG